MNDFDAKTNNNATDRKRIEREEGESRISCYTSTKDSCLVSLLENLYENLSVLHQIMLNRIVGNSDGSFIFKAFLSHRL